LLNQDTFAAYIVALGCGVGSPSGQGPFCVGIKAEYLQNVPKLPAIAGQSLLRLVVDQRHQFRGRYSRQPGHRRLTPNLAEGHVYQPIGISGIASVKRRLLVLGNPPGQGLAQRGLEAVSGRRPVRKPALYLQQAAPGEVAQVGPGRL